MGDITDGRPAAWLLNPACLPLPCWVCGAEYQYSASGRILVEHDAGRHRRQVRETADTPMPRAGPARRTHWSDGRA